MIDLNTLFLKRNELINDYFYYIETIKDENELQKVLEYTIEEIKNIEDTLSKLGNERL